MQQRETLTACPSMARTSAQSSRTGRSQKKIIPQTAAKVEPPSRSAKVRAITPRDRRHGTDRVLGAASLDRHALGEVPRLVHVTAPEHSQEIRQELKRQRDQDRLEPLQAGRNRDHEIGLGLDLLITLCR